MTVLKKVLFPLFFLATTTALFSQFSFGVRGGVNFPDIAVSNEDIFDTGTDFLVYMGGTIGVIGELKLSKYFAIQPELMFSQKGFKIDYDDSYYSHYYYYGSPSEETKLRLNYLEAPILAKGIFGNESITGFLAAGPVLGYAASATIFLNGEEMKFDDDDWDTFKRLEWSASVGGGVGLSVGNGRAFLDLRYLFGLTSILNDDEDKIWNRTLGVSVGYLTNL